MILLSAVVAVFARIVALLSHVWCLFLKTEYDVWENKRISSLFRAASKDPKRLNIFPGWTSLCQHIKGCNLANPGTQLMASVYVLCQVFHFMLQGRPPHSHLFESLFSGLFPGWLLLGACSPQTTRKSPSAAVQPPCATCLDYVVLTCRDKLNKRARENTCKNKSFKKCLMQ